MKRFKLSFSTTFKTYISLHFLLLIYSFIAIFSKLASTKPFLSFGFIFNYALVVLLLIVYAIGWQQILKKLPLSVAFANKSIVVIWGILWGGILFYEKLTLGMIIGSILVICGIFLVVNDNE